MEVVGLGRFKIKINFTKKIYKLITNVIGITLTIISITSPNALKFKSTTTLPNVYERLYHSLKL